ncbi:tyrosinase family oxidase copper chaperone [Streptomyces sp. NPDC026672]|uniref:tyrosinase family oxidase copper chaperone n=1 Tax=unclassified Streptomyces TaxID=2593676 RepID=UPI0033C6B7DF
MAVDAGGVPVGAERGAGEGGAGAGRVGAEGRDAARGGPRDRTRREAGRRLIGAFAALALAPLVAASRPPRPAGEAAGPDTVFAETYQGHRIQGFLVPAEDQAAGEGEWQVTVDGRPLHLMRRADGTWLTMLDHYSSYRTPLEATRAAVDEMGPGQRLRDLAPGPMDEGHAHMGGRHAVRA